MIDNKDDHGSLLENDNDRNSESVKLPLSRSQLHDFDDSDVRKSVQCKVTLSDIWKPNQSNINDSSAKLAFPLSNINTIANYKEYLTQHEQTEIMTYKIVYYINTRKKLK